MLVLVAVRGGGSLMGWVMNCHYGCDGRIGIDLFCLM